MNIIQTPFNNRTNVAIMITELRKPTKITKKCGHIINAATFIITKNKQTLV